MVFVDGEAMEHVITLPAGMSSSTAAPPDSRASGFGSSYVSRMLKQAADEVREKVLAGDVGCATGMSLATESGFDASDVSKICAELSAAFTSDPPSTARQNSTEPDAVNGLAPLIYQRAVDMVKADRLGDGIFTLALLLCLPGGKIDGLPGLATCAFRMRRHDAALSLALESLKLEVKHPRACCIAGLCELKRGDRRAAQAYLAAATRIARKLPEHRDDLRIAQRALLFMHLT